MTLSGYSTYQKSDLEWVGEFPVSWKLLPVKYIGRLQGGCGFPHGEQGVSGEQLDFHKVNALAQADKFGFLSQSENTVTYSTAEKLGAFVFPPKAIVFAKVGAALLLGRIRALSNHSCIDNNMMGLIVDEKRFDFQFVKYALELVRFDLIANPGTVPSLNEQQIGGFRLPIPVDLPEQRSIAAFLDAETSKIDALVAEQRRLIELLKEKRQAVISHAVTKGLNPHVKMKPSGIDWLGDVPEHWEVTTIGNLVRMRELSIQDGNHGESHPKSSDFTTFGIPFLMAADMKKGIVDLETCNFISEEQAQGLRLDPALPGDVLLSHKGNQLGGVAVVPSSISYPFITLTPQITYYRIKSHTLEAGFLLYLLQSQLIQNQLWYLASVQATRPYVGLIAQRLMNVILPPKEEQIAITSFLISETSKIDNLLIDTEIALNLLQERRTALISAAVTGKIDVRGFESKEASA